MVQTVEVSMERDVISQATRGKSNYLIECSK